MEEWDLALRESAYAYTDTVLGTGTWIAMSGSKQLTRHYKHTDKWRCSQIARPIEMGPVFHVNLLGGGKAMPFGFSFIFLQNIFSQYFV